MSGGVVSLRDLLEVVRFLVSSQKFRVGIQNKSFKIFILQKPIKTTLFEA